METALNTQLRMTTMFSVAFTHHMKNTLKPDNNILDAMERVRFYITQSLWISCVWYDNYYIKQCLCVNSMANINTTLHVYGWVILIGHELWILVITCKLVHLLNNNFPPITLITNNPMKLPGTLADASYKLSLYGFVSGLVQRLASLSLVLLPPSSIKFLKYSGNHSCSP